MDLGLTGKVALVTGASGGIGGAIAEALARQGCDVVAAARSAEALQELAETIGRDANRQVVPCIADRREADGGARAVGTAEEEFRCPDILVNNAGSTKRGDVFALSEGDWREGFALKFFGYVRMTRACWPLLKAAPGAVVNIIAIGGRTQGPIETNRLWARLERYAEETGLGLEEARRRLAREIRLARFGQAAEIGDAAAFLASTRAHYFQGALIDIDSGATRTM